MRSFTALFACASGFTGVLLLASGSAGAPTWRAPMTISPADGGPSIQAPQVAMNASGAAVIAWERAGLVQAIARRSRSEPWSAPLDLSSGRAPVVGIDASGGAVVAYDKGAFPVATVQAVSRRSASSDWEQPVTLTAGMNVGGTDVAVNHRGDAVIGMARFDGAGYLAEAAYRAAGAAWQPAVVLSDPNRNSPYGTSVAIDAAGNVAAVWVTAGPAYGTMMVMASFRHAATGTWESPVALAGPFVDADPQVAMDASGNMVAVWVATRFDGKNATESVEASFRPAGGSWTPSPTVLSTPTNLVYDLQVAIDPAGNALAAWIQDRPGEPTYVRSALLRAGSASWEPTTDVTQPQAGDSLSGLRLALDPAGNAVAAWTSLSVRAALRPAASGAWQPAYDFHSPASGAHAVDVAMDRQGNALAVWATTATPSTVEAGELDGTGPVFARVDVPERATARVAVTMSAETVAWASPVTGAPHWTFGDGSSADGTTVRHVFASPGSYTVMVTQGDAAGGTSSATRTMTLEAPTLANEARPSIRGRPRVGATVTCRPGTWAGAPPIRYAYSWLRGGRRVSAGPRRRLLRTDAGSLVACRVRATNPAGSVDATSHALRVRR